MNNINNTIQQLENSYIEQGYEVYKNTGTHKLQEFLKDTGASKFERIAMQKILNERGVK